MAPPPVAPQEEYLRYEDFFSKEVDHTFLEVLVDHKIDGGWYSMRLPEAALKVARTLVNKVHKVNLTWKDVDERYQFMRVRYRTFMAVASFTGVEPNYERNVVTADDKIWTKILKKNHFAGAYRYQGDPEYPNLNVLFGDERAEDPNSKTEVITTSRMGSPVEEDRTLILLSDEEEVTSPWPKLTPRKLFDDEGIADDSQSTSPGFPPLNAFPPKHKGSSSRKMREKGSSGSVASCSPAKFTWGPFR